MSIQGINTHYNVPSSPGEKSNSKTNIKDVDMDQFLTLFIAQMKNQDPLNPLDSAEFTSQLAQFTSVEQLYGMNDSLGEIKDTLNNQGNQQDVLGYIGRTVKTDDNTMQVDGGVIQPGAFDMAGSGEVTVHVYDGQGLNVRTLYLGRQDKGEHEINWDGRDDKGDMVGNGTYTFEVSARDGSGNFIPVDTLISGKVTGVRYKNGQPYLMIGDRMIGNINNIMEVSQTVK